MHEWLWTCQLMAVLLRRWFLRFSLMEEDRRELLCTVYREKGISPITGRPLHYKGSFFHRIEKGYMAQDTWANGHDWFSCDVVLRVEISIKEMVCVPFHLLMFYLFIVYIK